MADRLLDLGHRRFAVLGGPESVTTSEIRIRAFNSRVFEAGGEVVVLRGKLTVADGELLTRQALASATAPTAIFAVNNFLSFGALNAVKAQGLRIPADISIAGFDDLPEAMVNFPFLSVVAQPAYELGAMAARRLFERILNPAMDTREIVLSTTFRERSSTGPAPIR